MSFANTVRGNFAAPRAPSRASASPPAAPVAAAPAPWGGRTRGDMLDRARRGAAEGSAAGADDDLGRPRRGGRRRAAAAKGKEQAREEDALADGRRPALLVYVYFVLRTCKKDFWGTGIAAADVSSRAHVFKFQTVSVDAVVSDVFDALSSVAGGDTTGTGSVSISSRQHARSLVG